MVIDYSAHSRRQRRTWRELAKAVRRYLRSDQPLGLEVGVECGLTSQFLLEKFPQLRLLGVDAWEPGISTSGSRSRKFRICRRRAFARLKPYGARSELYRMRSKDAADVIFREFDFVFIDADHTETSVREDLSLWWPKIRGGGVCVCHDYGSRMFPGVQVAFDAFAKQCGLEKPRRRHSNLGVLRKPK